MQESFWVQHFLLAQEEESGYTQTEIGDPKGIQLEELYRRKNSRGFTDEHKNRSMSTGFSSNLLWRRRMSPVARVIKTKKPLEANSFYLQRQGVEEFKIASMTIKPSKFKRNKMSQQVRIQIIKDEPKIEKEVENKIIKVGEIKVWVTPNESRLKKNAQFSDTVEDELVRLNSQIKPTYDVLDNKLRNFDLEREVNYIPYSKLNIPFSNCYMVNHFNSGDLKMKMEANGGMFPHNFSSRYSKITSKSSKWISFEIKLFFSVKFYRFYQRLYKFKIDINTEIKQDKMQMIFNGIGVKKTSYNRSNTRGMHYWPKLNQNHSQFKKSNEIMTPGNARGKFNKSCNESKLEIQLQKQTKNKDSKMYLKNLLQTKRIEIPRSVCSPTPMSNFDLRANLLTNEYLKEGGIQLEYFQDAWKPKFS